MRKKSVCLLGSTLAGRNLGEHALQEGKNCRKRGEGDGLRGANETTPDERCKRSSSA